MDDYWFNQRYNDMHYALHGRTPQEREKMPYKAEERDGQAVVVNEETHEVREECENMEDARKLAHALNELEEKYDGGE